MIYVVQYLDAEFFLGYKNPPEVNHSYRTNWKVKGQRCQSPSEPLNNPLDTALGTERDAYRKPS